MRRHWMKLAIVAMVAAIPACGDSGDDTGQTCGEGTVASGAECVPAAEAIECGAGTTLMGGECVADEVEVVECGPDTELVDGECVSTVDVVDCGPDTELVDGECVSTIEEIDCGPNTELVGGECVSTIEEIGCGEGTILVEGACELIDPQDGIDTEAPEPNDPLFDGVPGEIVLGDEDTTTLFTGNIAPAEEVGEGEDTFLAPDFDVFLMDNQKEGQRISFEGTAIGAPAVAVAVLFVAEEGDDRSFLRFAFPFNSRNASKEMVLPFTGTYMVRVGTPEDTAVLFAAITEGEINFGGLAGDPTGADDFTWILGVTPLANAQPETFVGNASFTFTGDVRDAPQASVDAGLAGRIVALTLETGPSVAGSVNTSDPAFGGYAENAGLVVIPEDGLNIVVDSIYDRAQDTSFTLTALEQPSFDLEVLAEGGQLTHNEPALVGNNFQFINFTTEVPMVVTVEATPAEGSDTNLGMVLITPDLSEGIAGSFDELFGFFAPPQNDERFEAYLPEAGTYTIQIFHETLDEENLEHPYSLTISGAGVTAYDDLAAGDEQTLTDGGIGAEGAQAFYSVTTTELGQLTIGAIANLEEDSVLNVALDLHNGPFLAARDQRISAATADDGFEGEGEEIVLPLPGGDFLVRLSNTGFDAGDETADVTVALGAISLETEPNDSANAATGLGTVTEEPILAAGALAADVETTTDYYSFTVTEISAITISVAGVGETPAEGIRAGIYANDDLDSAIAEDETFIDFFTGDPVDPTLQVQLLPGDYLLKVAQIDDTATGDYLITVTLGETFVCLPGTAVCNGDDLDTCPTGEEILTVECEVACANVDELAGCGLVGENEPNDDGEDIGTLDGTPVAIVGEIVPAGEFDQFTFTVDSNAILTAETSFSRAPSADTILTLFDGDENQIITNDDGGDGLFSLLDSVELTAGTYTLQVEAFGGGSGNYRLSIDVLLAECDIDDDAACDGNTIVGCDGFFVTELEVCAGDCADEGDGPFCEEVPFTPEMEPNDGFNDGRLEFNDAPEGLPVVFGGQIADPGDDVDYYAVNIPVTVELTAETSANGDPAVGDTVLTVCSAAQLLSPEGCTADEGFTDGNNIDSDDDGGVDGYSLIETTLEPGLYFFKVESLNDNVGGYLLTIDAQSLEFANATAIAIGDTVEDALTPMEKDYFTFDVSQEAIDNAGGTLTLDFNTLPVDGGVNIDTIMLLCGPGNLACDRDDNINRNDDGGRGGGFYSGFVQEFTEPGTFFVKIEGFGDDETGDYALEIVIAE